MKHAPKGWNTHEDHLTLQLECQDFKRAIALLNTIGDIAEKQNLTIMQSNFNCSLENTRFEQATSSLPKVAPAKCANSPFYCTYCEYLFPYFY